jgi:threonine synthase
MERLRSLFPQLEGMRSAVSAYAVTDAEIRMRIERGYRQYGQIWCPHTATAAEVWERLPADLRRGRRWVVVATAHPGKFREIVEPLIGQEVPVPPALTRLFARPVQCVEIDAKLSALRAMLGGVPEWTS